MSIDVKILSHSKFHISFATLACIKIEFPLGETIRKCYGETWKPLRKNLVKRLRNRNPYYKKFEDIFLQLMGSSTYSWKSLDQPKKKVFEIHSLLYIMQSTGDVSSRAESQKAQPFEF